MLTALFLLTTSSVSIAALANKEQVLKEYQELIRYSANISLDMKVAAMRRISELQTTIDPKNPGQDPLASDEAQATFKKNITLYEDILKKYPERAGNDIVLYQLANAYEGMVDLDKAVETLKRLTEQYPDSRYVQEAVFRGAELLFEQMDFQGADAAYRDVLAFGEASEFYAHALYKHGWSLFKQERYEGSINSFLQVLDQKIKTIETHKDVLLLSQLNDADRALFFDTLRAISLSFSYLDDALSITQRLALHSEKRNEYLIYGNLGDLYVKKERYFDAAQVFQDFSTRHPAHVQAPFYHMRSIEAAQKGGFSSQVLEKKEEFSKNYRRNSKFWLHHASVDNPKIIAYLKETMQELARHYHALAQLSKKPEDFQRAVLWYKEYISSFKNDPNTAAVNFTLAEALYENGEFGEAVAQYEKVAYQYKKYEKSAAAGYAALLAYQKQTHTNSHDAPNKEWLERAEHFASTYPDHPQSTNVLLKAAEGFYASRDWERLVSSEQELLSRETLIHEQRLIASTMLGHARFELGLYKEAAEIYLKAVSLSSKNNKKKELEQWVASSFYKQGERERAKNNLKEASYYFQQVRKEVPGTNIQPVADYDAATTLFKQEKWVDSIMILLTLQQEFPEHPLQTSVPALLAVAYDNLDQPLNAAEQFIRVSQTSDKKDVQQEALWKAASLYENNHNEGNAVPLYKAYIKHFPDAFDDGIEMRQKLALYSQKQKDDKEYTHWLKEVIQFNHQQTKDKRTDRSRQLAAQAALVFVENDYVAYAGIHLVAPLEKNLEKKKAALQSTLNAYEQILEYSDAVTSTAATYQIAEMYRNFSEELLNSERPNGLNDDELEQYNILIEDQAFPFEDKAIQTHELNIKRIEQGLYNRYIQRSLDVLGGLFPSRYGKHEMMDSMVTTETEEGRSKAHIKALSYMREGRVDKALHAFQALIKRHPKNVSLYLNKGILLFNKGEEAAAKDVFIEVLGIDSGNSRANNFLGILARKQGAFAEAEAYYLEAIKARPEYAAAHLNAGILQDIYLYSPKKSLPFYKKYTALVTQKEPPVLLWIQDIEARLAQEEKKV